METANNIINLIVSGFFLFLIILLIILVSDILFGIRDKLDDMKRFSRSERKLLRRLKKNGKKYRKK